MDYAGFLVNYSTPQIVMGLLAGALLLGYFNSPLWLWGILTLGVLFGFQVGVPVLVGVAVVFALFLIPPIRRVLFSAAAMKVLKGVMPQISQTERTALEAGVVWSEADLFSGQPDYQKMMKEPYPQLTKDEKAFIDGPCEDLCKMIDDWKIWKSRDIPPEVLTYIKKHGFLGMIVPKEYGGLGFSAMCNSEVVQKITSRSVSVAITVMVPNSLGPAELLIHYGTDAQKNKWLPRLAKGEEMPCFGLTEPMAGSDAGSITSDGVLFKGEDGKIYIRLNWKKRWITLAAISTVIGLAFRLRDPENLLGRGVDLGITCALIPSATAGVAIGRRHDPLGVPFYNCPTEGKNVVVNAEDAIIGGLAEAGEGWKMLMESLAAGRGISLPAQSVAGVKNLYRLTSAHSAIRKQFGVAIGKFEGVEEPLARIGAATYYIEALRKYVLSALDQGVKPPVVTAIAKYQATEIARKCVNDGMDIMGGAGISMGPRNAIAIPYIASPIGITVEGANILTRTLIIFGQGALRAHPYAFKEVNAVEKGDLVGFDAAFWGHIGHVVRNMCRSIVLSVTRGIFSTRGYGGPVGRYFQLLSWSSASFAILSDMAMGLLGGQLKIKEKLTGRFADILSWMFIGTAVLRRFEAEGQRKEDLPFVRYSMQLVFSEIQRGFDGIFANFDVPLVGWFFKGPIHWWSSLNKLAEGPTDHMGHLICQVMMSENEQRNRFTEGTYVPTSEHEALGRYEHTFHLVKKSENTEHKIRAAVKAKVLPKIKGPQLIDEALAKGVITQDEKLNLQKAEEARLNTVQVDDYSEAEYHSKETSAQGRPLNEAYGK